MGVELLAILLSTGTAAMIWAVVQAWRAIRSGAVADEKDSVETADHRRRVAETDRDAAITVANYWRARAGVLEYILSKEKGPDAIPDFPPEPIMMFGSVPSPQADTPKRQDMPQIPKLED